MLGNPWSGPLGSFYYDQGSNVYKFCPPLTRSATFSKFADPQHRGVLAQEVSSLLEKGGIRKVQESDQRAEFYSHYFLILKKDEGLRLILDMRGLKFLRPLRCKC